MEQRYTLYMWLAKGIGYSCNTSGKEKVLEEGNLEWEEKIDERLSMNSQAYQLLRGGNQSEESQHYKILRAWGGGSCL
jgi:hypothetical protein